MTRTPALTGRELATELKRRGLVILGVGESPRQPASLFVYLHGEAGQHAGGYARDLISSVPGVQSATASHTTPTIIVVRVVMHRSVSGGA